jgi:bifunctional DNA-binding transcriptional regulator/antitoxin component of YhaV-PrlF toxin-antitoxin module
MTTSTLSQNGQTTIPAKVRQFLHVEPNHKILYRFEGEQVVLEAMPASTASLDGSLKTGKKPPTPAQLDKLRTDYAARKYAR